MNESRVALAEEGPGAPPRANGELIFDAPWQSRIFGLTVQLCEQGAFPWSSFQALLIEEIAAWETDNASSGEYPYYECWLKAFERLAADLQLFEVLDLDEREREFATRPHGHDHTH